MKQTLADKMLEAAFDIISANDPLLIGDPDAPVNEFVGLKPIRSRRTPEKQCRG